MTDLSSIAAREAAATPGPWTWNPGKGSEMGRIEPNICWFGDAEQYYPTEGEPPTDADAAFIAHARTDISFLLGEVSRLTAALATARAEGFEAGKEAAAKDCAPSLTRLKVLVRALDKDEGGAWTAEAHAIYCELSRALLASNASPAGNLKRGDQ